MSGTHPVEPATDPRGGTLMMLAACAFFAGMAVCVAAANRMDPSLSTWVTSSTRAWVNLLVLLVLVRGDLRALVGDARPALWARGFGGAFALLCYFEALARTGVGEAAFLNQTNALWVALAAPLLLGERTTRLAWVAIGGSLIGMALLGAPRAVAPDTVGRLFGLASGVFAASAYVAVRKAGGSNSSITIVFWFTIIATVVATGIALVLRAPWPRDPLVWLALVGAGVSATFGQLLMTGAYRRAPAALVAATGAAGPLFASVAGWVLLGDRTDAAGLAGMVLLLCSAVLLPLAARSPSPPGGAPGALPELVAPSKAAE